nr:carbohydrate-responsive element-binding protein-like [Aegilops tauschii subsp. strangulata]
MAIAPEPFPVVASPYTAARPRLAPCMLAPDAPLHPPAPALAVSPPSASLAAPAGDHPSEAAISHGYGLAPTAVASPACLDSLAGARWSRPMPADSPLLARCVRRAPPSPVTSPRTGRVAPQRLVPAHLHPAPTNPLGSPMGQ